MGEKYAGSFGFEDLEVYKVARGFRHSMYQVARRLPGEERFALGQQIRRAALSVTNNIAEGNGRYDWQDRTRFCRISRGSLFELVDDVNACLEEGWLPSDEGAALKEQAKEVHRLLDGYIRYLQSNKRAGNGGLSYEQGS